jgi:hypothetical protein
MFDHGNGNDVAGLEHVFIAFAKGCGMKNGNDEGEQQ